MTHYLVLACMPKGAMEHMLDELQRLHTFEWDKEFSKKHGLCSCHERSGVNVREVKLLEIDVPTPCTADFEKRWLGAEGFADLSTGNNQFLNLYLDKDKKFLGDAYHRQIKTPLQKLRFKFNSLIMKFMFRIFYKLTDKILGFNHAPYQEFYSGKGTIYRAFAPMNKRFEHELPKPYNQFYKPRFNNRNIVLGKKVEHPIGSYEKENEASECPKCKKTISLD